MTDTQARAMMKHPDCEVCGMPWHRHSGGFPNTCPMIATYRPARPASSEYNRGLEAAADAITAFLNEGGLNTVRDLALVEALERVRALIQPSPEGER